MEQSTPDLAALGREIGEHIVSRLDDWIDARGEAVVEAVKASGIPRSEWPQVFGNIARTAALEVELDLGVLFSQQASDHREDEEGDEQ